MNPLRGRVVVRPLKPTGALWTPDGNPREERTHRGVVLGLGAPTLTKRGAEVPFGFAVGAIVQYHFEGHEEGRTATWEDGERAVWLAQREVDAVIE